MAEWRLDQPVTARNLACQKTLEAILHRQQINTILGPSWTNGTTLTSWVMTWIQLRWSSVDHKGGTVLLLVLFVVVIMALRGGSCSGAGFSKSNPCQGTVLNEWTTVSYVENLTSTLEPKRRQEIRAHQPKAHLTMKVRIKTWCQSLFCILFWR